jgi:NAD(P)-dependent dehydrogenase (short-subunit alcohol dehydrogenase family)
VLNAGGMPESFETNRFGVELQFASQLFGHFLLARKLLAAGKLKPKARIVWVTSGGMYLKALDAKTVLHNSRYDKVATYANVKRAQVELLPYFARTFPEQLVTAMHPGWAATPGVANSIPGFSRLMQKRLRTPREGADTILWLLSTAKPLESGGLYFDRRRVTEHLLWYTRGRTQDVRKLQELLEKFSREV